MSKQQLVAGIKRTHWNLEEKIKVLNYSNKTPQKICRELATHFQVGKTAAASILKN